MSNDALRRDGRRSLALVLIAVALAAAGCETTMDADDRVDSSRIPDVQESPDSSPWVDVAGQRVFLDTCNHCHAYPEVWTNVPTEWGVVRMRRYSDLEWTDLLRDRDHHQVIDLDRRWAVYQYVTSDG